MQFFKKKKNWGLESGSLCKIFNIFIIIPSLLEKRKKNTKYKKETHTTARCTLSTLQFILRLQYTTTEKQRQSFFHIQRKKKKKKKKKIR